MAVECQHSEHHLHVLSDLRHIELLDENLRPVQGEDWGTVYATSFTNYIMPLIRYCLGDRTHWVRRKCTCGLPFPLIHRITGRESDVIRDKNGSSVYAPCNFVYTEYDSLKGYQFVVHDDGVITMKLIPNREFSGWQEGIDRIRNFYDREYSGRIAFTYELVENIPHDDGKLRFIVHDKK